MIIIDETNNPVEIQRQNKMVVNILVRYMRTLKYVLVNKICDTIIEYSENYTNCWKEFYIFKSAKRRTNTSFSTAIGINRNISDNIACLK